MAVAPMSSFQSTDVASVVGVGSDSAGCAGVDVGTSRDAGADADAWSDARALVDPAVDAYAVGGTDAVADAAADAAAGVGVDVDAGAGVGSDAEAGVGLSGDGSEGSGIDNGSRKTVLLASCSSANSKASVSFREDSSSSMTSCIDFGRSAGRFASMRMTSPLSTGGICRMGTSWGTGSSIARLASKCG